MNQFSKLTLKGPAEYLVVGYVLARAAKFSALLLTRDDVIRLRNMWDEVLVVLLGRAETLDVFSGDITDCIVDAFASFNDCPVVERV